MSKIYSNIVNETVTRKRQLDTLNVMSDALLKSFGPMGSHTAIVKDNGGMTSVNYTKDGKTIAQNIIFKDPIERTVQDLLTELTRYIVKEVGDGTTSAILLCKNIFEQLYESNKVKEVPPSVVLDVFNECIAKISSGISEKSRECTLDDIYNISLISTNNNKDISATIRNIYEKYGMDVYIDLGISNEVDNIVKEYDGMTLDTGFSNSCFINNKTKNSSVIRNAKIYAFKDAIDTPEMVSMLDAILSNNILRAYEQGSVYEPIPTVIVCEQKISPDVSSYLDTIVRLMNTPGIGDTVPLLIISEIHQYDLMEDIIMLTGTPYIKKYLNPDIQQADIEKGLAPTKETIISFCGGCEMVESDQDKTKFIKPSNMFDESGEYSETYKSILNFLENELVKSKNENDGIEKIGRLKRRINSLKGNMIDFLIGGVTESDRENLKDAVEDAVLNCRSAVKYGVGYGANFMAYSTVLEIWKSLDNTTPSIEAEICTIIMNSYYDLLSILYGTYYGEEDINGVIGDCITNGMPLNLRTKEFDGKVLSSIRSDIVILETINKILTLMYTCNQYLVQSPMHNIYIAEDKE